MQSMILLRYARAKLGLRTGSIPPPRGPNPIHRHKSVRGAKLRQDAGMLMKPQPRERLAGGVYGSEADWRRNTGQVP